MEKERLKFCIERYDHYYDSVNNKSAIFLTLSIFIVGGLVAGYPTLLDKVNCSFTIHLLMAILIVIGFSVIITVILASLPFISKAGNSLLYFAAISALTLDSFDRLSRDEDEQIELQDLRSQVHILAHGLTRKFKMLRIAGILFLVQALLFSPLITAIILNIK